MKKIGIVTGTRAEYGLLKSLISKFDEDQDVEMKLIVTGSHLSSEHGNTVNEIEKDGFLIDKKIEMLLSASTSSAVLKSMAVEMMAFADYLQENPLDIVVLLGDRYEILVAATAAMIFKIPIAHIHGGELTQGAFDEMIRHSITKMSRLHFPSTEAYRKRIIQLGEQPSNVYTVGALGVESALKLQLLEQEVLEKEIGLSFNKPTIIVTYHPVTLENNTAEKQVSDLLEVIEENPTYQYIFTKANADTNGLLINNMIDKFVDKHNDSCKCFTSLGQLRYLSTLNYVYMVIGNSSSGIVEAPSFHIPTINIGNRQLGRIASESVIHCSNRKEDIQAAFRKAENIEFREAIKKMCNPYEKENTSNEIYLKIKEFVTLNNESMKLFYDMNDQAE